MFFFFLNVLFVKYLIPYTHLKNEFLKNFNTNQFSAYYFLQKQRL